MLGLPSGILFGLVATPLLISAGQVLFKITSRDVGPFGLSSLKRLIFDPYLMLALAIYGFGTIVWIYVLRHVPLTVAYPFMALTFCAVPLLAWLLLGETLNIRYYLGTIFIVIGLLVING